MLNNIVHTIEVKSKDFRMLLRLFLLRPYSPKTTLETKVVLEGNCSSLQKLQIVVVTSKTLKRDVYNVIYPFVSFQLI